MFPDAVRVRTNYKSTKYILINVKERLFLIVCWNKCNYYYSIKQIYS